uniref:Uncharacterized protein n=1 Tax=Timema tahoe TaxID=61484 RepID=A0A7R9IQU9_9NEOP|nr:unnamed protein product [Timema tahoe]
MSSSIQHHPPRWRVRKKCYTNSMDEKQKYLFVGEIFPVGRIHRLLKELAGAVVPVYFAAIMEH